MLLKVGMYSMCPSEIIQESKIERRMNCLFITAGGRKVRVFELVSCSDQCPHPPNPPSPTGEGGLSKTNIQVFGFIFFTFT